MIKIEYALSVSQRSDYDFLSRMCCSCVSFVLPVNQKERLKDDKYNCDYSTLFDF